MSWHEFWKEPLLTVTVQEYYAFICIVFTVFALALQKWDDYQIQRLNDKDG